ncbi:carbohydrate kinase [Spirochaetia bacterium]|nr:carbohydrate kinase [Spirochaetia bacterium]
MEYAIAVIDIGMTNKKAAVYDETLCQLDAVYKTFAPITVQGRDSLEAHDLEGIETWFIEQLAAFAKKYPVKALAVSTHGATFVCVGKDGKPALPCVLYTHEPGEDFHKRFYEQFGKPEELQAKTGTPAFKAMINPAKGIFFAREQFPDLFGDTVGVLPYPQYWGLRFTGKTGVESTYMGNHTYLWDQVDGRLSSVARDLGIASMVPNTLRKSWDVLGTITEELAQKTGLSKDTIVTMGIHDSNSALLPHFAKKGETGFILNSTGTWCVIMNPVEQYGFAPDELGKVVFFNISAFGKPVKTAIFLGGLEFETWSKILMDIHKRDDFPPWDEGLYRSVLNEQKLFLLPELTQGSGQFPRSKARIVEDGAEYFFADIEQGKNLPPVFKNYEKALAVLRISLVMQTLTALEKAGIKQGTEVFTEGGFRKNASYNTLLASALPHNRVFLTDITEATALGAAMTAKMALTGKSLADLAGDFDVEYRELEKLEMPGLFPYRKAWTDLAS